MKSFKFHNLNFVVVDDDDDDGDTTDVKSPREQTSGLNNFLRIPPVGRERSRKEEREIEKGRERESAFEVSARRERG